MTSPRIMKLDPKTANLMADAALQAYNTFGGGSGLNPVVIPPEGFEYTGTFSGNDPYGIYFSKNEPFGVIFKSKTEEDTYIFSFRGTDSFLDGFEDIFANTAYFRPYHPPANFPNLEIADGFSAIYRTATTSPSLQSQVFTWVGKLRPKKLYITGHSLGSALCELFTLDAGVSLGADAPIVYNLNFACPRVGKTSWGDYYDGRLLKQTVRVVNTYDFVPKLPPNDILHYVHVGEEFLISFFKDDYWVPHPIIRHSIVNYKKVIAEAMQQADQQWAGVFIGDDKIKVRSVLPPADSSASIDEIICRRG